MSKNLIALLIASLVFAVISSIILGENIFNSSGVGYVFGRALGSVGIAVIIGLIPAGIYWIVKRNTMPRLNIVIWMLWAVVSITSLLGNMAQR